MRISVVIPVYNEEKCIGRCLKALADGTEKPYEIIVSDGMSTDRTEQNCKKYGAIVVENEKKTCCRREKCRDKKSERRYYCLIDADCIPDKDWLKEIRKAFEEDDIDGLSTYIRPAKSDNKYEEFWGRLSLQILMSYGDEPYYVQDKTLNTAFITASCAYRRSLLCRIKGFNNFFANNAEDIDICWRALEQGAKLKYVPSAKITAHSPRTLKGICKKSFRNGISSSKLQKVYSNNRVSIDKTLYKALVSNIKGIFKGETYSWLFVVEIICHLAGKYYGSVKCGVINI